MQIIGATALIGLLPGPAVATAELEVTEWSRGDADGADAHGYFSLVDPSLVSHSKTVIPVGDGSGDAMVEYDYSYSSSTRINSLRSGCCAVIPALLPGHSYAKASGHADAGASAQDENTNLGAFAYVFTGETHSVAAAIAKANVDFTFTIGPGASGAAVGDAVTGLRWEFGTNGFLSVQSKTYPHQSAVASSERFDARISRGPTAHCGPLLFDCPRGAYAASVRLDTSIYAQSLTPADPGDPTSFTGQVARDRTWDARNNSTLWGGGTEIASGGEYDEIVQLAHGENKPFGYVSGAHTGGSPLDLHHIDFDATVGETLRLSAQLTAAANIDGVGSADADMFGSYSTRIFDPLGRGYDITFSVEPLPVPELPVGAMFATELGALALLSARRRRAARRLFSVDDPATSAAAAG